MRRWLLTGFLLCFVTVLALAQQPKIDTAESVPIIRAMPPAEPLHQLGVLGDAEPILVDIFSDLELLLITFTKTTIRPEGWNGVLDISNAQLPLLIRLDLELLAGLTVGETQRPIAWRGVVPGRLEQIAVDTRYDLELLADAILGINQRPNGWIGYRADKILMCNRATQTLVDLLERKETFFLTVDPNLPNYCDELESFITRFTEQELLSIPPDELVFATPEPLPTELAPESIIILTDIAVSFYDKRANNRAGIIPFDSVVLPIARSVVPFSRMTLVEGEDFAVFIDYENTNLTEKAFEALPDSDFSDSLAYCDADWCNKT